MKTILFYSVLTFLSFCCSQNNDLIITEFQNNRKVSEYEFVNDTISQIRSYDTQTGKEESRIKYEKGTPLYKNNIDLEQDFLNYLYYLKVLENHGVKPHNPIILGSDLNDLANIFSVADNYSDYKKTELAKADTIGEIRFINFNKNIRFSPSLLTMFIPENTVIKNYQLDIKNFQPIKEYYITENGTIVKDYFYKKEKLMKIIYRIVVGDKETNVFEKKFEYKK